MAEEVAEIAIDVLIDVIASLTEELGPESEIITELTSLQSSIGETITADIQEAIANGSSTEDATSEALKKAAENMSSISEEASNVWIENMQEKGYIFDSGSAVEDADFGDTDPESDPDKGDPDTPECQEDPESAECLEQKQSLLTKVKNFFSTWGPRVLGPLLAAGIAAAIIFIGQVARWICQLIQKMNHSCDNDPNGESQCIDQKCNSALCTAAKNMVTWIRTYWIEIAIILGSGAVLLTWYFKAISPLILCGVCFLIILGLKSALGNMVATILCDVGASNCLFQGLPINC